MLPRISSIEEDFTLNDSTKLKTNMEFVTEVKTSIPKFFDSEI